MQKNIFFYNANKEREREIKREGREIEVLGRLVGERVGE
jgi:hypothetical protein